MMLCHQKTAFTVKHILCLTFSSLFFFFFLIFIFSRIPGKTYMIIAFLTVGTMGLSNTSLGYLNYPTQVIFKCCKLIPVMIGGVFIQGQLLMLIHIYSVRIVSILVAALQSLHPCYWMIHRHQYCSTL